jgi:hypothetical protein
MLEILFPKRLARFSYFLRVMPLNLVTLGAIMHFQELAVPTGADIHEVRQQPSPESRNRLT